MLGAGLQETEERMGWLWCSADPKALAGSPVSQTGALRPEGPGSPFCHTGGWLSSGRSSLDGAGLSTWATWAGLGRAERPLSSRAQCPPGRCESALGTFWKGV